MKPMFAPALLAAVVLALPAPALASGTVAPAVPGAAAPTVSVAPTIRSAADRAVRAEALQAGASGVPTPRPYQGRDRSRKQMGGGSKAGMVIGMVGALAGTAATIYMVKEMQKNNRDADGQ
jgi:hypothetical protein